jgi:uncharacterized FlaG/YvyC family protein
LANPLVNSKEEFDRHLHLHRKRVLTLGLAIRERFYPHLNYQELKSFLKYHDIGKTDLIHGKLQTSLSDLYRHYGTNLHDKEHEKLQKLVERINQIDKKIAMMFLESYKVSEQNRPLFKKIEWLADITDRGMDPVASEEFGRKLKRAVEFALDDESKEIVIWLQENYDSITNQFQYCKHSLR